MNEYHVKNALHITYTYVLSNVGNGKLKNKYTECSLLLNRRDEEYMIIVYLLSITNSEPNYIHIYKSNLKN